MKTPLNIIGLTVVMFFTTVSCIVNNIGDNIEKYVEKTYVLRRLMNVI